MNVLFFIIWAVGCIVLLPKTWQMAQLRLPEDERSTIFFVLAIWPFLLLAHLVWATCMFFMRFNVMEDGKPIRKKGMSTDDT